MHNRRMMWLIPLLILAYGCYAAAVRTWENPAPFLFGALTGIAVAAVWHYLERLSWKRRELAYREYASYVANNVSLIYLKHAPCPTCGHSPQTGDELADGFGVHAATCPILGEITEFGDLSQSSSKPW